MIDQRMHCIKGNLAVFLLLLLVSCRKESIDDFSDGRPLSDGLLRDGKAIIQHSDGGYLLLGEQGQNTPTSDQKIALVHVDASGNLLWSRTLGDGHNVGASDILPTPDGNYLVMGTIYDGYNESGVLMFLAKVDPSGNTLWSKTYDDHPHVGGGSIIAALDGGYLIAATLAADRVSVNDEDGVMLLKVDDSGNESWNRLYYAEIPGSSMKIKETTDGGYLLLSRVRSYGVLSRLDISGNVVWKKEYLGFAYPCTFIQSDDRSIMLFGLDFAEKSLSDLSVMKLDTNGNEQWRQTYQQDHNQRVNGACRLAGGGYAIVGGTTLKDHFHGTEDLRLWKIDDAGNLLSTSDYGPREDQQYGVAVIETANGALPMLGTTWGWGSDETRQMFLVID